MTGHSSHLTGAMWIVAAGMVTAALYGCASGNDSLPGRPGAICGNGIIDKEEECDGSALGNATCGTFGLYGGTLTCTSYCTYDTRGCGTDGRCGDGIVQSEYGEECDGTTAGRTCQTLGFRRGTLKCANDCTYDTSDCTSEPSCGDGFTDPGEVCDGSCPSFGDFTTYADCPDDCSACTYISTVATEGVDRGGRSSWSEETGTHAVQFTAEGGCYLALFDDEGTIQWLQPTGDGTCYLGDVLNDGDRIYVGGGLGRTGEGVTGFVACYSSDGHQLWWNDIPKKNSSVINAIEKYGENIFVAGSSDGSDWDVNLGERDMIVGILNPDGEWLGRFQFGTPEDDNIKDMAIDEQGDLYIAGITKGNICGEPQGDWDGVVFKTNIMNVMWCHQTGSPAMDKHLSITLDDQDTVYVVGQTSGSLFSESFGAQDAYVMAIDRESGLEKWSRQHGTTYPDTAVSITSIGHDIYMTFSGGDPLNPQQQQSTVADLYLLRLAPDSGSVEWARKVVQTDGYEYGAYVSAMPLDSEVRRFVLCGTTLSTLLPTDTSGRQTAYLLILDTADY